MDHEESELNHRCVAAPIFDFSGKAIASIGVSGSNDDLPDGRIDEMAQYVVRAAQRTSKCMGYVE